MVGEFVLRIHPELGYIKVETCEDGVISHKEISNETLVECLRGSLNRPSYQSGLLPENCISFFAGAGDDRAVCILHPEQRADISYHKTCYTNFPLPRLIFKFSLHQGLRVNSVSVCVVEEGRLKPDSKLFAWPFSNVGAGGHMCIGNNVMPKCESLHTLSSLPYHILSIPNNNDHYSRNNNKMKLEYRDLLELLKDKDPSFYYSDILVPEKKTLNDFINKNN